MPRYLPPRLGGTLAVAVCDRCKLKAYLDDLVSDVNSPGLRVHRHCADLKDPYRLPPRKTERIDVRYPRPEVEVPLNEPDFIGTEYNDPIDFPPGINT